MNAAPTPGDAETIAGVDVWETITAEARDESPLWASALLPPSEREEEPVFSPLGAEAFALGLETIYEGYLLHYGRPRLFAPADRDTGVLLGDYLYAHGLVRIAALGEVAVVGDLSELISLCAQTRADGARPAVADGVAWAATAVRLGSGGDELDVARAALRDGQDHRPLEHLARAGAGDEAVDRALRLHADRVV
jgi:hypothetical protein